MRQRDASQADAGLCGALDAVVQPVGGADDKRHIPCAAHGAVCNHSCQILTGYLLTLDTERNEIRTPAHAGQDSLPLLLQRFGDLPVAGVLVGNLHLGQFDNTEIAEAAEALLVFGHALRKVGGVHLANGNQINILHRLPRSKFNIRADLTAGLGLDQHVPSGLDARGQQHIIDGGHDQLR